MLLVIEYEGCITYEIADDNLGFADDAGGALRGGRLGSVATGLVLLDATSGSGSGGAIAGGGAANPRLSLATS